MFSSIETVELLGDIATGIVIVGLVFEYFPHFRDRYVSPWYERPSALFHVWGPIMVIGGIALELSFHHISTGIQSERDVAQQRIIAELRNSAAGLEKDAADARERAAEIEKYAAWREITPLQSQILVADLASLSDFGRQICVYRLGESAEVEYFSAQFSALFERAGLRGRCGGSTTRASAWDLHVPSQGMPEVVTALRHALTDARIPFLENGDFEGMPFMAGGDAMLVIGPKRPMLFTPQSRE